MLIEKKLTFQVTPSSVTFLFSADMNPPYFINTIGNTTTRIRTNTQMTTMREIQRVVLLHVGHLSGGDVRRK